MQGFPISGSLPDLHRTRTRAATAANLRHLRWAMGNSCPQCDGNRHDKENNQPYSEQSAGWVLLLQDNPQYSCSQLGTTLSVIVQFGRGEMRIIASSACPEAKFFPTESGEYELCLHFGHTVDDIFRAAEGVVPPVIAAGFADLWADPHTSRRFEDIGGSLIIQPR